MNRKMADPFHGDLDKWARPVEQILADNQIKMHMSAGSSKQAQSDSYSQPASSQ